MSSSTSGTTNNNDLNQNLRTANELLEVEKQLLAFNKRVNDGFAGYLDAKRALLLLEQKIADFEKAKAEYIKQNGDAEDSITKELDKQVEIHRRLLSDQRQMVKETSFLVLAFKDLQTYSMAAIGGALSNLGAFILDADKAWRALSLNMGLSGTNSLLLRQNLQQASVYGAHLGNSFKDLAEIQGSYTEEMGNAVLLSEQNLNYLTQVGKGTAMGTVEAGKMAAKFNLIGKSVRGVRDFYEEAVNQSERFGVSANEVLKAINSNLEKSQEFVFKGGTKGLRQMAIYATKFKIDMGSIFSAMEKSNSLEGAVDMAAQLQVLGGNFAKTDPFKLLYEARNDGEAFTKTMQGLTKGMYSFNRSNGELEITAGDMQRLRLAAEATGMPIENLIKTAQKAAQVDMMGGMMGNLSPKSKDFIESVAQIQKNGKFTVQLASGEMKDIRSISEGQVQALIASNSSLEERAREAQSFDEILTNTINELKSGFLPLLTLLGDFTKWLNESSLLKPLIGIGASIMGLSAIGGLLMKGAGLYREVFATASGGIFQSIAKYLKGGGASSVVSDTTQRVVPTSPGGGAFNATAAANMAAFGAAVALVGAGVWMATEGIAAMATAFKGLSSEQLDKLNNTLIILGGTFAVLSVGIAIVGTVASAAALPMLAFGGAVALIGAGIGIAAVGLGYMAKGFGEMFESLSHISDPAIIAGLSALVFNLSLLAGSLALFANPLTWIGLSMLGGTISNIGSKIQNIDFTGLTTAGTSFQTISKAIESINEKKLDKLIEVSKGLGTMGSIAAMFASLSTTFGDGIEVKFTNDKVNLNVDVTANMDGQAVSRVLSRTIPLHIERDRRGG